jgi:predicted phosphodiesterase
MFIMKLAVLSDIHANLEAFQAVLADIDKQKINMILTLGDNVGYGPDPGKVVYLLQERRIATIMGNHERAVANTRNLKWFNPAARQALEATIGMLSSEAIDHISALPKSMIHFGIRFVHGFPPSSPMIYLFQVSDAKIDRALKKMEESICFVGHTHDLTLIVNDGGTVKHNGFPRGTTRLHRDKKYIINIGSVGQPRDGNLDAKYGILDVDKMEIELRYIEYEREKTAAKIIKAGLPSQYADRLLQDG